MNVIARGRQEGKTTDLLREVIGLLATTNDEVMFLIPDGDSAELRDRVRRGGLKGVRIAAFVGGLPITGFRGPVVFDNIDLTEEGIWHPALQGMDLRIVTCTIPSTRRRPWMTDRPEKVTGIDLSDEEQIADAKPVAVGDTAEELLEEETEDEEETEEDEGRTPDPA